ncbi:MAG TPA: IPT/TIG domain-containing protein, partial [Solirubrobacteraceae bacterium]|nr:IPT/TIG domain-containing protein [Solirubrobacteraceae bacterium]
MKLWLASRGIAGGLLIVACGLLAAGPASAASTGAMAWGENEVGQLGNGTTLNSEVPSPVRGLSGVSALAGGERDALALLGEGTVVAWGANEWGQLGDGTDTGPDSCRAAYAASLDYTVGCSTTPTPVEGLSGVVAVAAGAQHNLALLGNGTVMAWGDNELGQLGEGTFGPDRCHTQAEPTQCSTTPIPVSGLSEVTAIAAGEDYSLALLRNGTVMAWGSNEWGELGDGGSAWSQASPTPVANLGGVTAIAAGGHTSLALLSNGTVMAWGANEHGELGDGTLTQGDVPVAVSGLSEVRAIAVAGASLALRDDGTVMAWGSNISGQLGVGTLTGPSECFPLNFCSTTPVAVSRLKHTTGIATGGGQSLALLTDGTVAAWGLNWQGQLGIGTRESSTLPIGVRGLSQVTALAAGDDFSLANGVPGPPSSLVTGVAPNGGPSSGGTSVTITGSDFNEATAVKFGSSDAASFTVESDAEIEAVSPPGTGAVDVTVETHE